MKKTSKMRGVPAKMKGSNLIFKGLDVSVFKEIQEATETFNQVIKPLSSLADYLRSEPFQVFQNDTLRVFRKFAKEFEKLEPLARRISSEKEFEAFCVMNTLVPHRSIKNEVGCFSDELDFTNISRNWKNIRRELFKTYAVRHISNDRHSLFNEILKTFTIGAYSICRRAAIIEIEGLASDFCEKHGGKKEIIINNSSNKLGEFTPGELGGMLPFIAIEKYSKQILANTESYKHTGLDKPDLSFNRHAHAHGSILPASKKDALNAILLLHHYAKYFELIDKFNNEELPQPLQSRAR